MFIYHGLENTQAETELQNKQKMRRVKYSFFFLNKKHMLPKTSAAVVIDSRFLIFYLMESDDRFSEDNRENESLKSNVGELKSKQ